MCMYAYVKFGSPQSIKLPFGFGLDPLKSTKESNEHCHIWNLSVCDLSFLLKKVPIFFLFRVPKVWQEQWVSMVQKEKW